MNKEEFKSFWKANYTEAYPIGHELKWVYSDRWFRIHSLPNSKRYADNETEYQTIFDRQNQLFDDLIGKGNEIVISFGLYSGEIADDNYEANIEFKESVLVDSIDLRKARPEEYEDEMIYDIFIKSEFWESGTKNHILRAIADDEIRAMFICPTNNCIISPYDGGVDVIVESTEKRDELKTKYGNWLSKRKDGM